MKISENISWKSLKIFHENHWKYLMKIIKNISWKSLKIFDEGWRASCMMMWNTTEGGPCLLRPSGSRAADSPDPTHYTYDCVEGYDEHWQPRLRQSSAAHRSERSTGVVKDWHKDTVIGGAGTERIYYRWDHYIADSSPYNRSFPCMEATLMP